jgi:hypothetical protein
VRSATRRCSSRTDAAGNTETAHTLSLQINPAGASTLPPTNSLTLSLTSQPATLGSFTAGTAGNYTTTVALTISTGVPTATLSASDRSTLDTGHLVNTSASGGPYELAQGLQASASDAAGTTGSGVFSDLSVTNPATLLSYSAPAMSDAVTVTFKQPIGAGDPLRTGSYSKTITLTLSTTSL